MVLWFIRKTSYRNVHYIKILFLICPIPDKNGPMLSHGSVKRLTTITHTQEEKNTYILWTLKPIFRKKHFSVG